MQDDKPIAHLERSFWRGLEKGILEDSCGFEQGLRENTRVSRRKIEDFVLSDVAISVADELGRYRERG